MQRAGRKITCGQGPAVLADPPRDGRGTGAPRKGQPAVGGTGFSPRPVQGPVLMFFPLLGWAAGFSPLSPGKFFLPATSETCIAEAT